MKRWLAARVHKASGRNGSDISEGEGVNHADLGSLPPGWDFDLKDGVQIGKLAVKTGIWPLKE
jgi:hypothetical protein